MELISLKNVRNKVFRNHVHNSNINKKHILKYSNRKMFDREKGTYVTLAHVYEKIRADNTVRVIEKLPGVLELRDVTSDCLASYIRQRIQLTNLDEAVILDLIRQVG